MMTSCFLKRRKKKLSATVLHERRPDVRPIPAAHGSVDDDQILPSSDHYVMGPRSFSLNELRAATDNFSEFGLLGRGGFGNVYKGTLPDGSVVAVKRIADHSRQGLKEFRAELTTIGSLRHRNLVKLKGWSFDETGNYLLVYECMANGSLDCLLFNDKLCAKLTWRRRWSIALGLGAALQYLHDECDNVIIHRDVKASNVLLDDRFNAKLGDFGLSREVGQGVTSHYTTMVAGTRGYMGPELHMGLGRATKESDMFAFGGVLLEIATGKCVIDMSLLADHDMMLLNWVWDMYGQGKLLDVVDKRLERCSSDSTTEEEEAEEAKKLLVVGLACSHPDPKARPSIRRAMEALNGAADQLPWVPPSRPLPYYGPLPTSSSTSSLPRADSQSSSNYNYLSTSTASNSSAGRNPLLSASSSDRQYSSAAGRNPLLSTSNSSASGNPVLVASSSDRQYSSAAGRKPLLSASSDRQYSQAGARSARAARRNDDGSARAPLGMDKTQPLMLKWVMGQRGLPLRPR